MKIEKAKHQIFLVSAFAMLVLFETPAGYALFKLTDESALEDADQLAKAVASPEKASKL